MKRIYKLSATAAFAVFLAATSSVSASATEKSIEKLNIKRVYNYNWQSVVTDKHPNAAHFHWTPMFVNVASKSKHAAPIRNTFKYQKPIVMATVIKDQSNKAAITFSSIEPSVSAAYSYAKAEVQPCSSYSGVSANYSYGVKPPKAISDHPVALQAVAGRLIIADKAIGK